MLQTALTLPNLTGTLARLHQGIYTYLAGTGTPRSHNGQPVCLYMEGRRRLGRAVANLILPSVPTWAKFDIPIMSTSDFALPTPSPTPPGIRGTQALFLSHLRSLSLPLSVCVRVCVCVCDSVPPLRELAASITRDHLGISNSAPLALGTPNATTRAGAFSRTMSLASVGVQALSAPLVTTVWIVNPSKGDQSTQRRWRPAPPREPYFAQGTMGQDLVEVSPI
ncbi:hypothetical protein B0T22DRAFT_97379 [Podospora appendiculata]|uniref:Uncharacterized protein n=1 Tax=Podospora appendiculata TaxID=314037 RepID=A0AAE0XKJ7_9PEZI|nr:hypothetical protein B0T22DRAFT_97379 [Podospora appendiculata]